MGEVMEKPTLETWEPKTALGREVKEGRVKSLSEILRKGIPIKEPEIVEFLAPNLEERILSISFVQRMHKSGRRTKYRVLVAVGNKDGLVGVGHNSAREIREAIRKATVTAKMNLVEIARGCGSWECMCDRPHSVPVQGKGKWGSVEITIKPAPRGLGLVASEVPKTVLELAGVKDAWTFSRGETRTTINFSMATLEALKNITRIALVGRKKGIHLGPTGEGSGGETGG
ncbi:MAG: 30S ribosomal protein S5 [Candidatus Hadarchaeales archaeon]